MADFAAVVCPTCGEAFDVPAPPPDETPCEWDYDCEVCCAPMVIMFAAGAGGVTADARGLGE